MLTLVQIPRSHRSSADTAGLIADYTAFDRQRVYRRQFTKAFAGMAILVLLGALFGRVPRGEALIAAALLATPPIVLGAIEAVRWHRLARRLDQLRGEVRTIRKS